MARRPREYRIIGGKLDPETGEASPVLHIGGKFMERYAFTIGDIVEVEYRDYLVTIRWMQSGRHLERQQDLFDWKQDSLIDISDLGPQPQLFAEACHE